MIDKPETEWTGGYRQPPYGTRFQKGQSGNPKGRRAVPKRPRAMGEIGLEHLRMPVAITVAGKKMQVPVFDRIMINGIMQAAKTDSIHQINRFLENLAKLGFNYAYEQRSAGIEDRAQLEEVIAAQARVIDSCHAALRQAEARNARLERGSSAVGGTPDGAVELP